MIKSDTQDLIAIYEKVSSGVVDSKMKTGDEFEGAKEKAKDTGTDSKSMKDVDDAEEMDDKFSNRTCKTKKSKKSKNIKESTMELPESKFDQLFRNTLNEEINNDNIDSDFDDEEGDFPVDNDTGDGMEDTDDGDIEMDDMDDMDDDDVGEKVKECMRTMIDIAKKVGAYESWMGGDESEDDGEELDFDEDNDLDMDEDLDSEDSDFDMDSMSGNGEPRVASESAQAKLKPLRKSTNLMTSKKNIKVKSSTLKPAKKRPNLGLSKQYDGKLKSAKKSKFINNKKMKADAKGKLTSPGTRIFD